MLTKLWNKTEFHAAISVDATNHVAVIVEAGPGHFDDESDSGRLWIALAMVTNSPRVTTRSDCVAAECPAGLVTLATHDSASRSARSLGRPDAALLALRVCLSTTNIVNPSTWQPIRRSHAYANVTPLMDVTRSMRFGGYPS